MRTLIVENDKSTCEMLKEYLSDYGDCCVAVDGPGAVEQVRESLDDGGPYDLICIDIMTAGMDGHDVLRSIRQMEKKHKIKKTCRAKVIVITALSDFNNIANAFRSGCDGYLIKPVGQDDLLEQMQKLDLLSGSVVEHQASSIE